MRCASDRANIIECLYWIRSASNLGRADPSRIRSASLSCRLAAETTGARRHASKANAINCLIVIHLGVVG